jgi:hypothetical protein
MGLSKKHNIELFDNISYIFFFISETSNVAMEDGQYIFIRNIGCASWARVYFNIAKRLMRLLNQGIRMFKD